MSRRSLQPLEANMTVDLSMMWTIKVDHSFPRGMVNVRIVPDLGPGLHVSRFAVHWTR